MREPSKFAQKSRSPGSADGRELGRKLASWWALKEQFSYFSCVIAPEKKIISLGSSLFHWSTDHERYHREQAGLCAPVLAGHLGGRRLGTLYHSRRRRGLPARPLVTRHVVRDYRR